ncbi:hypothetical protein HAX54_018196, partial [Datura stramonium]|nr:hypothetical protein [Datura stramonium]
NPLHQISRSPCPSPSKSSPHKWECHHPQVPCILALTTREILQSSSSLYLGRTQQRALAQSLAW